MPTHTTPPPHADQTDQTAEPARRASRFDERGIALQTVIIMVVLLAIAGGIAAVLLSRGQAASNQLEDQALGTPATSYTSSSFCRSAGFDWDDASTTASDEKCRYPDNDACIAAGGSGVTNKVGTPGADKTSNSYCRTSGGTFLGKIV